MLEIGSGCGYALALLSVLVSQAYGVEIEKVLAEKSRKTLKWLNIHDAEVVCGDGYEGYSAGAPYDAILLSAAPDKLPETLFTQLRSGGKMVLPVGKFNQLLELYEKKAGKWQRKVLTKCVLFP
ncbi:MAG: hypothetical protein U5N26_10675 [Candidatus Marinimicrobia bacterium]|nr:hypothetical protein [Candidatus Neomarinimicrobiota bacterium]